MDFLEYSDVLAEVKGAMVSIFSSLISVIMKFTKITNSRNVHIFSQETI